MPPVENIIGLSKISLLTLFCISGTILGYGEYGTWEAAVTGFAIGYTLADITHEIQFWFFNLRYQNR